MGSVVDTYLLYKFVRGLSTPFTELKTYKLGLTDENGNWAVPKNDRTSEQNQGYTYWDVLILNLKKMLAKIPGGSTRIGTFAAALYLLREGENADVDLSSSKYEHYLNEAATIVEDEGGPPTNNMGSGNIADPKAPLKKGKVVKRFKELVEQTAKKPTKSKGPVKRRRAVVTLATRYNGVYIDIDGVPMGTDEKSPVWKAADEISGALFKYWDEEEEDYRIGEDKILLIVKKTVAKIIGKDVDVTLEYDFHSS